ncbi:MAG: hypothetical protein IKU82_02665 [Clostridia bacterium]|nr:hypothetical protein [Clostridia bacterium]
MIKTEIKNYLDYGRVLLITNDVIETYVTIDVGPRIIRFGYVGGQNIMCDNRAAADPKDDQEFQDFFGLGKKWEILGGHRIWTSPESYPQSYYPDLDPVKYEITENGAIFTPNAETQNGVQKQLEIKMDPDDTNMFVTMNVTNIASQSQEFSIWGLTVSSTGGTLIIPMNTNDTGLLANRNISVWPYTNLADSRLHFGNRYVTLRQDDAATNALKLGFDLNHAELYYCLGDDIFRKSYATDHKREKYPDNNCSFETYTCATFIEVESLSPLKKVQPGDTISLTEHWSLLKKPCDVNFNSDTSIDEMLGKL